MKLKCDFPNFFVGNTKSPKVSSSSFIFSKALASSPNKMELDIKVHIQYAQDPIHNNLATNE